MCAPHYLTRTLVEWYQTLGHTNSRHILQQENGVSDMKVPHKETFAYEPCMQGKLSFVIANETVSATVLLKY